LELKEETRVRFAVKQTGKGLIQIDVTTESPTVEKTVELMGGAIDELVKIVRDRDLKLTSDPV
jgi:hypothetical protein